MHPKRILIADDDTISRTLLADVLQDVGYEVALAADGEEAILLLTSYQPDLVLTDFELPDLDGTAVLYRIQHVSPHLPIIVLTAHSEIGAQREARRLGAADYINKPVNLDNLRHRVADVLAA